MADGRRTLGDISRAVNNLDKNPTRLLFGAGNSSTPAPRRRHRPRRSGSREAGKEWRIPIRYSPRYSPLPIRQS